MKILGISGSPRDKRTNYMIRKVLKASVQDYELLMLKDLRIGHCVNCGACRTEPFICAQNDDIQLLHQKLIEADAFVFGSPVYFDNVSGLMKDFFDRCLGLYWSKLLHGKRVALVTCAGGSRESSVEATLTAMVNFCRLQGLEVIGKVGSLNKNPESKDIELETLGKKLVKI